MGQGIQEEPSKICWREPLKYLKWLIRLIGIKLEAKFRGDTLNVTVASSCRLRWCVVIDLSYISLYNPSLYNDFVGRTWQSQHLGKLF